MGHSSLFFNDYSTLCVVGTDAGFFTAEICVPFHYHDSSCVSGLYVHSTVMVVHSYDSVHMFFGTIDTDDMVGWEL